MTRVVGAAGTLAPTARLPSEGGISCEMGLLCRLGDGASPRPNGRSLRELSQWGRLLVGRRGEIRDLCRVRQADSPALTVSNVPAGCRIPDFGVG